MQLRGLCFAYAPSSEGKSPGLVWITSETFRCFSKSPWLGNQAGKLPSSLIFFFFGEFSSASCFWLGWKYHKNGLPRVFQKFRFQSHLKLGCAEACGKDKMWNPAWSHSSLDFLPVYTGWRARAPRRTARLLLTANLALTTQSIEVHHAATHFSCSRYQGLWVPSQTREKWTGVVGTVWRGEIKTFLPIGESPSTTLKT